MAEPPEGGASGPLRAIENDALIESSFRRLLAAIESEQEKIRSTWLQIEQEKDATTEELQRVRQETDDWCYREQQKVDAEWAGLQKLVERTNHLWPEFRPGEDPIEINCSGRLFTIPRSVLCGIEGSILAQWFSDAYHHNVPRDAEHRYLLDLNPECFAYLIEYLWNRRLRPDAPLPIVPFEQHQNMDSMAEALKLWPFLRANKISPVHSTSLVVKDNVVVCTHPGWQVISAVHPLSMSACSYYETQVHSIRLTGSILYISGNGLISDICDETEVEKFNKSREPVLMEPGGVFGLRHEARDNSVQFYYNGDLLGTVHIKLELVKELKTRYPIFAMYVPDSTIRVNFEVLSPT
eukprot:TRINITY_DN3979_c0_g1_i4.p1 TRINITY_DN3979_c0_g1~~TRINITY_DN3979_c0_g1_i4.p1  ORF type:complete len:352 (+),score=86.69 TRINITY_DN3979_c0_g1_i4:68-1123(+)